MKFFKSVFNYLRNPHAAFCIVWIILTAAAIGGNIVSLVFNWQSTSLAPLAYVLYALAAVFLAYSVYLVVKVVPKIKNSVKAALLKREFTGRILQQYSFRTIIFAVFSFAVSLGYAVLNGVIGIWARSTWYGALAGYYLLLVIMRGGILIFHRSKRHRADDEKTERALQLRIYRNCGIILTVIPLFLSAALTLIVRGDNSFEHPGLTIYPAAAYTFYKIIMAVYNIFKARRGDDYTVRALRAVNLADALVSVLALQTAMFKEFAPDMNNGYANAATGLAVCVLTVAIGVFLIVNAQLRLKAERRENTQDVGE